MKANMRREIVIDENGNGIVTKAFAKQARIFGTEEYKLWKEFKIEFPDAEMVHKTIKKNPEKKSEPKISYAKMKKFIEAVEDDKLKRAEVLAELDKQIKLSKVAANPYQNVLNWFKNYDKYADYLKSVEAMESTEENEAQASTYTPNLKVVNK